MSHMLTDPKVSVVMAAYNASGTIERSIKSVVSQTMQDWELIVVNDASTDDTGDIAARWSVRDPRISVVNMARNARQSAARNHGIAEAKGAWIAILDADDAFEPHRLDVLVREAERGHLDMVADNQKFFDMSAGRVSRNAMRSVPYLRDWTLLRMLQNERVGRMFKWGLLKPLVRRSFIDAHEIRYAEQFHMGEDCLFYAEILANGAKAAICGEPMYVYTTARGELTGRASGVSSSRYRIEDHLATFEFFRAKYAGVLRRQILGAITDIERSAYASEAANRFKAALRTGRPSGALAELIRYPDMLGQFAVTIWKRLRYRLAYAVSVR